MSSIDFKPLTSDGITAYEDLNNDGQLSIGETVRIKLRGEDHFFVVQEVLGGDFYQLATSIQCPENPGAALATTGTPLVFNPKYGFLFRNQTADGIAFMQGSMIDPWDISTHSLVYPFDPQMLTQNFSVPGNAVDPLALFTKMPEVDASLSASDPRGPSHLTAAEEIRQALSDPKFLAKLGFASVDELYRKYHVTTEGELPGQAKSIPFFSPDWLAELGMRGVYGATFVNESGNGAAIIISDMLIERICTATSPTEKSQWLEALRSVVLHECLHAKQGVLSAGRFNVDQIKDPALQDWFHELSSNQAFTSGREIFLLWNYNPLFQQHVQSYQSLGATESAAAAWITSLMEAESYIKQVDYILKQGATKFPPDFVIEMVSGCVHYFDASASLLRIPSGRAYLEKIFAPLMNNPDLQQAMLETANALDLLFVDDRQGQEHHYRDRLRAFLDRTELPM